MLVMLAIGKLKTLGDYTEKAMATHSSTLCLEKSHGRRSLEGCSPWDLWGLDTSSLSLSLFTCMHWRRQWQPTLVLFAWKNPMDGGAWKAVVHGIAEGWTRVHFHFHFSLACIGEANGNPLQCSCLENPRDGRAWRAAVSGVAQSRTWLKWQQQQLQEITSALDFGYSQLPQKVSLGKTWSSV